MARRKSAKLVKAVVYGRENELLSDHAGRGILDAVLHGVDDSDIREMLYGRVEHHMISEAMSGLPFRKSRLERGDLKLGFDAFDRRILRCSSQCFNSPLYIGGTTGSGKTNLACHLCLEIALKVKGTLLIDFRKKEFARLKPHFEAKGIDLQVLGVRDVWMNPLQSPDNCDPRDYAANLADMFSGIVDLGPRGITDLHSEILRLYEEFGVRDGSRNFPALVHLREAIKNSTRIHPQTRDALLARLDPILMSLPNLRCCQQGWTATDLAQRHIVVELGDVSDACQDLFAGMFLLQAFKSRIDRGISNPKKMNWFIVCDEIGRVARSPDSSIAQMINVIRGTGIGLLLSNQSARVAPSILTNTPNKMVGQCASHTDYATMGASMGLTAEQIRWLSIHLVPGLFLGHLCQGSWRHPFLFKVPNLNLSSQ